MYYLSANLLVLSRSVCFPVAVKMNPDPGKRRFGVSGQERGEKQRNQTSAFIHHGSETGTS
jgi:hypothetical protein